MVMQKDRSGMEKDEQAAGARVLAGVPPRVVDIFLAYFHCFLTADWLERKERVISRSNTTIFSYFLAFEPSLPPGPLNTRS